MINCMDNLPSHTGLFKCILNVGNNFYCEAGFPRIEARIAWEDPLWDGQGCVSSTAQSCSRYGWFHRDIAPSQEDIEFRWCSDQVRSNEDFYTDLLEIWVLSITTDNIAKQGKL